MARPKGRRRIRKLRLFALLALLAVLGLASFSVGLVTAIAGEIPALDPSRIHNQTDGFIYANNGRVLSVLRGSQSRILLRSDQISPLMKQAIVAIEDKRFYEHRGVDVRGIMRALWADMRGGGAVQGGSTITQQFVKNTYTNNQRSIARKLREAALAWQLEQRWSKDRILTAYLNTIYFGNGAYGVEQAAQTYFHHGAGPGKLTLWEAALLAGIPEDPAAFDPATNQKGARARRNLVLKEMFDQGDISRAVYGNATRRPMPSPQAIRLPGDQGPAQYFANYVKQQLVDRYGSGRVFGGGLKVYTTIDLKLQKMARNSIGHWLTSPTGPTAALVSIDPRDGRILAMFGGNNFRKSQFNLAVQGERQAGSSFKPFVLATALKEGVAPTTTFVSKQVTINAGGRLWEVHNYEDEYLGPITIQQATAYSDNAVFAQLTKLVGPQNIANTAKSLGIKSRLQPYFSIGLGAQGVNPLEMARAFSAFANGGKRIDGRRFGNEPRVITKVATEKGRPIDDNTARPVQTLSEENAALVTSLLQNVIKYGTGKAAALAGGRPAAGKTGTTENYGDAWFVGYTPQLVTAVWVGYPNDVRSMSYQFHGKPVAGGTFPALIWKSFMERALPYLHDAPESFAPASIPYASPKNVTYRDGRLQLDNGYCRDTESIEYFGDSGPTHTANCLPNEVDVPNVVGEPVGRAKTVLAGQPLAATVVYRPAQPRQRVGVVVKQFPAGGRHLSSGDRVTIVLSKALEGLVPNVVGMTVDRAKARLKRLKLEVTISPSDAPGSARIIAQSPRAARASAPGMGITLAVKGG
ncbi:MAG: PBP1A family penicillin-binding protein [Actinobacteria bacterium]|nr:MAG: PBP1A family penicillin-binding protein [Actinomycetota bacterium]